MQRVFDGGGEMNLADEYRTKALMYMRGVSRVVFVVDKEEFKKICDSMESTDRMSYEPFMEYRHLALTPNVIVEVK